MGNPPLEKLPHNQGKPWEICLGGDGAPDTADNFDATGVIFKDQRSCSDGTDSLLQILMLSICEHSQTQNLKAITQQTQQDCYTFPGLLYLWSIVYGAYSNYNQSDQYCITCT